MLAANPVSHVHWTTLTLLCLGDMATWRLYCGGRYQCHHAHNPRLEFPHFRGYCHSFHCLGMSKQYKFAPSKLSALQCLLLISLHFLGSASVSASPTVLRVSMPPHLIQLLDRIYYVHLPWGPRWPEISAELCYWDVRLWKANIGVCTHRLLAFVQILLPRLSTTELGDSVSSSSGMVGRPTAPRVFISEAYRIIRIVKP